MGATAITLLGCCEGTCGEWTRGKLSKGVLCSSGREVCVGGRAERKGGPGSQQRQKKVGGREGVEGGIWCKTVQGRGRETRLHNFQRARMRVGGGRKRITSRLKCLRMRPCGIRPVVPQEGASVREHALCLPCSSAPNERPPSLFYSLCAISLPSLSPAAFVYACSSPH